LFEEFVPKDGGGLVDYILGAEPSFGVFVLATTENPMLRRYLQVYKMGSGPLYTFYRPHHLSPLEVPLSIARAALFGDAALAPKEALSCEVVTLVKKDMKRGETLDGMGGFTAYGMLENYETAQSENLLPIGLSEGCILKRDLSKDETVTYNDVEMPRGRLCDKLRAEQENLPAAASLKLNVAGD
jgi:predicted homoserine dehydrogenase-like protein